MSRLLGGLFSRPSGKTSGLVFGAGRTKRGKQVTAREYTIPTDPKTNAQVSQRGKMPFVTRIIQGFGRDVYQFDWNRAVKNLPGFQSLSSVLMDAIDPDGAFNNSPRNVTLGTRHFPDSFTFTDADPDLTINWSTELGDIGAADDQVVLLMFDVETLDDPESVVTFVDTSAIRSDGTITISNSLAAAGTVQIYAYFKSEESGIPSRDKLSVANYFIFER